MSLILFCIAVALAMVFGPQTTPWTWGPGLVALGLAVASLGGKRPDAKAAWSWLYLPGWLCIGWFFCRALWSPVREDGISDAILAASVFGAFQVGLRFRREARRRDGWFLAVFLAVMIVANALGVAIQPRDPSYTPVFGARASGAPSGVLGHYNEFSNVMLALGFALLSFVFWGGLRWWARMILFPVFPAAMICIYLSHSRGGLMGAGAGAGVFTLVALLEAKRRKSRWFAPGVILLPLALLAAGWFVFRGIEDSQIARKRETSAQNVLDDGRLYALGLAAQCVTDHPWQGGGSHSFSWESRHYLNVKDMAWAGADIFYVHNELVQALTDYGLVGGGLLVSAMACLFGRALLELIRERRSGDSMTSDAWLAGAVAGAAAILTQSNFAFVFHNLPSSILLGFFLGIMAGKAPSLTAARKVVVGRGFPAAMGYGLLGVVLLVAGIRGSRALVVMWPAEYAKDGGMRDCPLIAAGKLAQAAGYWPHSELYKSRAEWLLRAAKTTDEAVHTSLMEEAEAAWREARRLHPLNPVLAVNHANTLSYLGRDQEALTAYDDAIRLQGGYECGVQAFYRKGLHLRKMAFAKMSRQRSAEALSLLLEANKCFRAVRGQPFWYFTTTFPAEQLQALEITASLQALLGRDGEVDSTLAEAAALPNGWSANYLYAVRLYDKARALWHDRQPGKALALFLQAKQKLAASSGTLLPGITPDDRQKLERGIEDSIKFLQGAQVKPE